MSDTETKDYEREAIEILTEIVQGWDTDLEEEMTASTRLVADLGFESLDVVYLVTAIEQRYGRRDLPMDELLMTDGRYVEDLSVGKIADFLNKNI